MHRFAAILDTRAPGSRHGIQKKCPLCQRKHMVWACFREVVLKPVPGDDNMVRYENTGFVYVVGTECAKKVTVPVWEDFRVKSVLEAPSLHASRPGMVGYDKLFQEFRG
jgi:hypothetical protein